MNDPFGDLLLIRRQADSSFSQFFGDDFKACLLYTSRVHKPYIGDAGRKVEYEDIRRANRLMYLTAWMGEALCLFCLTLIDLWMGV